MARTAQGVCKGGVMDPVLVTGCSGLIGRRVAERLHGAGVCLRILYRVLPSSLSNLAFMVMRQGSVIRRWVCGAGGGRKS